MIVKKIAIWLYIALLLCITLVFFRGSPYARVELDPIASYRRAALAPADLARIEILALAFNTAMFVPIGILAPMAFAKLTKIYLIMPAALSLTLTIETAQLLTGRGVFSVEDMLHNTAGALVGWAIWRICSRKWR
ncbi:MAG: VanZ family protein [Defluviitaleaceae bacterium]|nr:VanZ family protein [Defluviitaleaceae bacterium]